MVCDMFGTPIQVGQIIAYGVSYHKVGQLRVGIVKNISNGKIRARGFRKDYSTNHKLKIMDGDSSNVDPDKIIVGPHIPIKYQIILEDHFNKTKKGDLNETIFNPLKGE